MWSLCCLCQSTEYRELESWGEEGVRRRRWMRRRSEKYFLKVCFPSGMPRHQPVHSGEELRELPPHAFLHGLLSDPGFHI